PVRAGQPCATASPTLPFVSREDVIDGNRGAAARANRTRGGRPLGKGRSRGRRGAGGTPWMGCGGRRGAAGLRCDATATGQSRRGDVVARSWGGRKWRIASRGEGIRLEGIESNDLADRSRLQIGVRLGEMLDTLGLVEVRPFDLQDVGGLL